MKAAQKLLGAPKASDTVKKLQRDLADHKRKLSEALSGKESWEDEKKTMDVKVESSLKKISDLNRQVNQLKNAGNDVCSALDKAVGVLENLEVQQQQSNPTYQINSIKELKATLDKSKGKFRNVDEETELLQALAAHDGLLMSPDSQRASTSRAAVDGSPVTTMAVAPV